MSHIPKRKSTDEKVIVDLSAIPPQDAKTQPENPLAGLMPLPPDSNSAAGDAATRAKQQQEQDPLKGLVSPPPDISAPKKGQQQQGVPANLLPEQGDKVWE